MIILISIEIDKNTIMYVYNALESGGAESLILRMARWCFYNGYSFILIRPCGFVMNKELASQLEQEYHVSIVGLPWYFSDILKMYNNKYTMYKLNNLRCNIKKDVHLVILSSDYRSFLVGENIKEKNKARRVDNFYYVITRFGYRDLAFSARSKILYCLYHSLYRKIAKKILYGNSFIFMGNGEVMKLLLDHYKLDYDVDQISYICHPMEIVDFDEEKLFQKIKKRAHYRLLSVARFSFPEKGYLIGLVSEFYNLCKLGYNVSLTIIGYGDDKPRLLEVVNYLPQDCKARIQIIGPVQYDELYRYFANTDIYIGSATTIFDAINNSVPAIVAKEGSETEYANGIYWLQTFDIVTQDGIYKISDLVQQIINMDDTDYVELVKNSHLYLTENFSVDNMMNKLINLKNLTDKPVLNCWERNLITFIEANVYLFYYYFQYIAKKHNSNFH